MRGASEEAEALILIPLPPYKSKAHIDSRKHMQTTCQHQFLNETKNNKINEQTTCISIVCLFFSIFNKTLRFILKNQKIAL